MACIVSTKVTERIIILFTAITIILLNIEVFRPAVVVDGLLVRYGFNPQLVARLRYILANTGCKIVVSSSWRHHTNYAPYQPDRNWRDVLAEKLGKTSDELYAGSTPTDFKGGRRGIEINKWLEEHPVDSFCVVDDETVDITPFVDKRRVVKTDMKDGLTRQAANRIIEVLNNGS